MISDHDERDEHRVRTTEHEAQANLKAVLQLCAAGRLRCGEKTLRPSAATVKTVAEALSGGDFYAEEPIASFAWPLLLQAGGLAELTSGKLALTARGRAALTKPAHETLALLWRRWLTHGVIDEFSRVEAIKGQRAANVLTAVKPRRTQVGASLAACAPGEWTDVDTLFRTMRKAGHDPRIARTERALWKLYLEDPEYGSLGYDGFHNWELLQGRYTLAVLFEYAAVLGLIDVDHRPPVGARDDYRDNWGADWTDCISRYDGLLALRLNPLGAYATGQTASYLPTPAPADTAPRSSGGLKVLPNHDVVALDGLAPTEGLLLDAFAKRTGDRVWALTSASLLAAVDAGRDLAELRHHLNAAATVPLPQTVTTLLADAARRVGQVRDTGPVHLIECADPAVAALLATDRRTRAHCTRLGELHLAVPLDRLPAFRKAALAQGYPVA
ncbi:helicase-associated domain-containing protein [Streptomyces europaeiscabiei]|uniref:helicase-associated domain-containing protein n=1 Tax=Streptomyces europaeiscabiei TaxID=146819 RepID=UPI0029BE6838|nr:helicase-associated domain-containing protein [Streptomyces europaeiscabiei]MDX3588266.1 helicase-associated domain-containing protein [Streptomyces europaeiscabiei]